LSTFILNFNFTEASYFCNIRSSCVLIIKLYTFSNQPALKKNTISILIAILSYLINKVFLMEYKNMSPQTETKTGAGFKAVRIWFLKICPYIRILNLLIFNF
jgi:hypothetical protein